MVDKGDQAGKVPASVKNTHGVLPFEVLSAWAPPPPRRAVEQIAGGRRPVVAVIDTGVAADHAWFSAAADGPVLVDASQQWDWPRKPDCLFGPQHGTFVAGVVRQNAPDATILSVRLDRDDTGRIKAGQIHEALTWVRNQTAGADPARFVDVVCLAVGFRSVNDTDDEYKSEVKEVIGELADRGVLVVAASGNTSLLYPGPVYPAGLAPELTDGALPLVAVGATEPDGTPADFTIPVSGMRQSVGVGVFSITPRGLWPAAPDVVHPTSLLMRRVYLESVWLTGFAVGSGTSYAAAGFAGKIAHAMLDDFYGVLDDVTATAAIGRASRALWRLQEPDRA